MRTPARVAFGFFVSVLSLLAPAALGDNNVTATKSVSGSFVQGTNVTYTVVMTNNMEVTQNDNPGTEFRDPMPSGLMFVSASASSGTAHYLTTIDTVAWDGSIPAGGSVTLTIVATINPAATGLVSNQGQTFFDADGNGSNESSQVTDDPSTATAADATSFNILQSGIVSATKSVSGTFVPGTDVTYTIVMTNNMTVTQGDNDSHEFTDSLPDNLTLVSISATSGTISSAGSGVLWDGALAASESVTMTIVATISPIVTGEISNQGQTVFDRDGDNQNESNQATDDPSTAAAYDATSFIAGYPGAFEFSASNYDVSESAASFDVTVNRTGGSTGAAEVNYSIAAGTAQGADFVGGTFGLSFADGETSKTFNVTIVDDAIDEPGQTIALSLSDPTNGTTIGAQSTATITIQDDDAPPTLSIDDVTLTEGDSGSQVATFTITKSGETEFNVTVTANPLLVSGTATCCGPSNDWGGPITGTTFFPATTTRTAQLTVFGDLAYEDDETVIMTLTNAVNATISDDTGVLTILNNDSVPASSYTATKTVSGSFVSGSTVTYTVVLTNDAPFPMPDNSGDEFQDVLPAGLTLVSADATSGTAAADTGENTVTWNGAIASGESVTITITAVISAASGTISNQGTSYVDLDNNGTNETNILTGEASFNVIDPGIVTSTMSVSGTFVQGTDVTYTVVMTNNMSVAQDDNFGHEWTDIFPSGLTPVSVSASSGTIAICCGSSIVFWDGSIASGESVTLTIVATIGATASGTISNQGQTIFDRDGDNQNESSQVTDDPSTAAEYDATSFNVIQSGIVTSTMSVSGTLVQGTDVTYTVVMTNNMSVTQPDNFGHEWTDILPSGLTLVSVSATSGTTGKVANIAFWDGSLASGGSATLTIVATIGSTASGTISNQGQTIFDRNGDSQNESSQVTDDPSTAASYDATSFNVIQSGIVTSTMSVSGTFVQGTNVTYTVVMTNNMSVTQPDNFGHEWTDILPTGLTPVSVSASSGTIAICCGNSIVFWDGSIASGASVTLTIVATIGSTASGTLSNQGQTIFDRNGDNQNESSQVTDDPSTAASYDATSFTVIAYQADLSLTMSYAPSSPGPSDNITYTLVVSNSGPLTATNVVVTDDRPNDATFQSVSTTQGSCTAADPVVCSMGSLANGASATITLVVKAPSSYDPLTNSATATSDLPDPTPASASAAITCTKSNGKPCKK